MSLLAPVHGYRNSLLSRDNSVEFAHHILYVYIRSHSCDPHPASRFYAAPKHHQWAHGRIERYPLFLIQRSLPRDCASSTFFFTPSRREASRSTKVSGCMKPAWPPSNIPRIPQTPTGAARHLNGGFYGIVHANECGDPPWNQTQCHSRSQRIFFLKSSFQPTDRRWHIPSPPTYARRNPRFLRHKPLRS